MNVYISSKFVSLYKSAAKLLKKLHICKFFHNFAQSIRNTMTNEHYVYRQTTLDFVTAAAQTCLLLEHASEIEKDELIEQLLQLLPILYVRTRALEPTVPELDGEPQQFVQEEDYNFVLLGIQNLLGSDDTYLTVLTENQRYTDEPCMATISEDLADIYQELKDLAANFQTGQEAVMNDAVYLCRQQFTNHWGQKLLNTLATLHALQTSKED